VILAVVRRKAMKEIRDDKSKREFGQKNEVNVRIEVKMK
jgi:hypothetical protein